MFLNFSLITLSLSLSLLLYSQELFHGPTFAFKDVALQMLGNFFEYFLDTGSNGGQLTVLGATSGDTGSAAIAGLRGKRGVSCVILYPHGRVSHRQELQMITVPDENVYAVAVKDATFDDCQDFVKASFNTPEFRDKVHLGAVNSINWCRVLAQTTYYYWSYFRVTSSNSEKASFSVPTGNFGDILAGFYSKQMGLPVDKLVVATNENDILHRFFTTGKYERELIQETISPSMDICVSSNFERYLFWLAGNDPSKLKQWMNDFEKTNILSVSSSELKRAQGDFLSSRVDTAETISVIGEYHKSHNYLLCPHSAVGVKAIHNLKLLSPRTVCLATADQGKFPDAVRRAVDDPPTPDEIQALEKLPIRRFELVKDLKKVQDFVESRVGSKGESFLSKNSVLLTAIAMSVLAVAFQMRKR